MTIRLAPIERRHLKAIYEWLQNEELRTLIGTVYPVSWRGHLDWYHRISEDRGLIVFAIEQTSDRAHLGMVGLRCIDMVYRNAEIWIYIGDDSQRQKGIGRAAIKALLTYAFETLGLHRIFARVFAFNQRALAFFSSLGMHHEGIQRDAAFKHGSYCDVHVFSLLASEYLKGTEATTALPRHKGGDLNITREEIHQANIQFHSTLAEHYDDTQPFFRKENRDRVQTIIKRLADAAPTKTLLDVGCGTGFIIQMAAPLFSSIVGIDITPAMLERAPHLPHAKLILAEAEKIPIEASSVGVTTAYGVLHHLHSFLPVFREIHRVLQPGGIFYADESPNFHSFEALEALSDRRERMSDLLKREVDSVVQDIARYQESFGLDRDVVATAMFQGKCRGGIREGDVVAALKEAGFRSVEIKYRWFLGQGQVRAEKGDEVCRQIEDYLTQLLPATRTLFKYVSIFATK